MSDNRSLQNLLSLDSETILVTGASGNIGQAIASRLAEAGAAVVAHCNSNRHAVEALVERIGGSVVQGDLSDASAIRALLENVNPSMVVNNAAIQPVVDLKDMTQSDWQDMMTVNLDSVFVLTQGVVDRWQHDKHAGTIVNIASIEGLDPAKGHAHYATSKAGLLMYTRAVALEYGAIGIRANSVSPGLIDRPGLSDDWPEGVARWLDRAPLGRLGSPNDVADAVLFLLSPAARWISGANLVVDGGLSAQGRW